MAQQDASMPIGQGESAAARQIFLFSGHMVDAADRSEPRFPPDKEPLAAAAISALLDQLGAGAEDVAISSAACGGDLLFAEACLQRGVRVGNLFAICRRRIPSRIRQFRRRALASEVLFGEGARPGLAHNGAGTGADACGRRSLCPGQSMDAKSRGRLWSAKYPVHLPLGWQSR